MTSNDPWDDPDLKIGGEFVKFENVGDTVSGTISVVRKHTFDDGSVSPQILLVTDTGEDRTVTAGQSQLKSKLAALRPTAGDHITITYTQNEKRSGGKTLKHFDVTVNGGAAAPAQQLVAVGGQTAEQAAEQAAAIANLTPEQKAALGL